MVARDAVQEGCAFAYPQLEVEEELTALPVTQKKGAVPVVTPPAAPAAEHPWPSPVASSYSSATPWPVAASPTAGNRAPHFAPSPVGAGRPVTMRGIKTYSPFGG